MNNPVWSRDKDGDDVDQLMLNARLRDELEPYLDESVELVSVRNKPTSFENEYLASMLAWERAPVLPIFQWFDPPLELSAPESLADRELREQLWMLIHRLYDKQIVLDFTDHLSDYELYCLILRDILPSHEKKLDAGSTYLHWHCLDPTDEPDTWLRFYASEEEREAWGEASHEPLPPAEDAPYPRRMPRRSP
ncbi:MAG: hypothetical protein AAGF97_06615 [Planctomycetota bacterium]